MKRTPRSFPTLLFLAACALAAVGCSSGGATTPRHIDSTADNAPGTVVATVAGKEITLGEVEDVAAGGLIRVEQQRYDVLRAYVERMGMTALLQAAADDAGMSIEELRLQEVEGKVQEPTQLEIARAYEANIDRAGGRSLEELRQNISNTIRRERIAAREVDFFNELKDKYGFAVTLPAPRIPIEVTDEDMQKGNPDAPITIVEYGDFECPFCRRAHSTMERVQAEYGDKVRYVFRDFPVENHLRAVPASEAAYCAAEQDRYWDYFEHLMVMTGDLNDADLRHRAEEIGLDIGEFMSCYTSGRYTERIEDNIPEGNSFGVSSTPTFFINGRMLIGAKNFETFKLIIDEELAEIQG